MILLLATLRALAAPVAPWPGVPTESSVVPVGGRAGSDGLGPRGAWVVARPVIDGIPVEIHARVRLDAQGAVRRVWRPALPPAQAQGPIVDEVGATAVALRRFPGTATGAALGWRRVGGGLRRFWTVDVLSAVPMRGFLRPRVTIDAETGAIAAIEERAVSALPRGHAYRFNPIVEPEIEDVPLAGATDELASQLMAVRQCADLGNTVEVDALGIPLQVHVCTVVAPAQPIDGDYYHEPVPWPPDPAADEDAFVAANVFWNVRRGLDWFAAHGWEPKPYFDRYLWITVNQRYPNYRSGDVLGDPRGPLVPYDNAFFSSGDGIYTSEGGEIVFGQGNVADYGYDADVILHELGHFIVDSRDGPQFSSIDAHGYSIEGQALNEAFADYFSSVITGDPVHGEYVNSDGSRARNLSGTSTCAHRFGEPHYDGEPFAQALWTFRTSLADDVARDTFDAALVDSLTGIGEDATFALAVEVIGAEVADVLGADAGDALAAEFVARGLDECVPIVEVVPSPFVFRTLSEVPPRWEAWLSPVPGLVQFRVEVPAGGATLVLRGWQSHYRGLDPWLDNEPNDLDVVGRSGDSLTWAYGETTATDSYGYIWTHDGEPVATFARTGTREHPTDPADYYAYTYEARWTVREPGTFVFQLTNDVDREAWVRDLTLALVPLEEPAGCGCAASPEPMSPIFLVGAVAVAARRRRR
jgi:MYXO-CTERM domain-containing protein